ncbi:MAG: methionyl-tRNA formyltransferase [Candidatus Yanofskybacteria bacterium RIFCSPHIGHO2_02_FULL_44_12b]|uniref:Methionyl-tRNA formyltransferase n=2 Tax=Candidatus Yanofskyibacteriota TaxID=1752733 RepID=A0A1F8GMS6_9BACT|nr:MAG: Methionyl-tRNA formyltransferase [Candidatus Yanofskybacteria bacterium GW2011_GWA2_44_9]OGN04728.1 MAG: methionyl-tRNA formyltransferase [Candidatus Yanofskybacteria bacterium RIFCSPHIGHO2_01_FULL_44_24]OGN15608.1 MAG: methionyl-tRNA formyltransferase [Candidatus Yanofskybacteria bacterium RIFCSPHIGHO2_02_FULL_44_12b]OGN26663.1 MAG: methionyl-tRNA formyltransferase [Candidatus Yanofskybacteria bacterium RIFCSPLOWO2_01_FULL_44_22]
MLKSQDLNAVFFGTPAFAVPAFKYLLRGGYNIVAAVTQPEKLAGRQRITMPSHIKKAASEYHVPVLEPHDLKDDRFLKEFKKINPDIALVAAYGKIIPAEYLSIPKYGFINIHPSLLPKYRGPSPIQAAIMNGDDKTGVTIIKVDEKMDHGPILASQEFSISLPCRQAGNYEFSDYKTLEKELSEAGGKLLLEILPEYTAGKTKLTAQNHDQATFTKLLTRHDGKINWDRPAEEIYNRIRALNPEPGTWTLWQEKTLNIKVARPSCLEVLPPNIEAQSGTVVNLGNDVAVTTQKCYLILKQIQLEGRKAMDTRDFINGHPDFLNSRLK